MSASTTVSVGTWLVTQSALLFASYGLGHSMPWWVVWFPSVFLGCVIGVVLIMIGIILIVEATQ